jgi:hypothetical protein
LLSEQLKIATSVDSLNSVNSNSKMTLNELVQLIMSRKGVYVVVQQQLRHIFQWIIDLALYLTTVAAVRPALMSSQTTSSDHPSPPPTGRLKLNHIGASLLDDINFLNDLRKAFVYIKLLQVHPSGGPSLPVLPLRALSSRDLINELYSAYSKIIFKIAEGKR